MDSSSYENLKNKPRPGHGDYGWTARYGTYDYRGGGRGSGRTTIGHVIGGAVAKKLLNTMNIKVISHVTQVGTVRANKIEPNDIEANVESNNVRCADPEAAPRMEAIILHVKEQGDSVGGVVETVVLNAPAGLGEPVFRKLDSDIASVLMGIGSVKGVEIGVGFHGFWIKGFSNE